jgi:starch-binding outer membrane protein, SusD/RagB family
MKKILFSLLIIAVTILVPQSCSKDYLDTVPTSGVSSLDAVKTTKNAWASLNGIHRMMYMQWSQQDQGGHGGMMINIDYMGEDMVINAQGSGWYLAQHRWLGHPNANAATTLYAWRMYYRIIANANIIIELIDAAEGPVSEKEHIKGQALTYRAWAHFQLVQLYGKRYDWNVLSNDQLGVPIMITSTTAPQPRATVEAVYIQINEDLDAAILLLDGKPAKPKSHFNVRTARGIKARVALTMGDWTTAASYANQARTGLTLMNNAQLLSGFSTISNPEFIWASEVIPDQTTYFYSFYAYNSYNFSSSMIRANPKSINSLLYESMSATDTRRGLWEVVAANARARLNAEGVPTTFAVFPYQNFKFKAAAVGDSRGDLPYMRTAELILIEAEAYAQLGGAANELLAQQTLFTLMSNRDPASVQSVNTGQDLIDEILRNRRIELWGEGFRWFDLKRLNLPLDRNGANHSATWAVIFDEPAGTNLWQWLIPRDEINANPLMEQNP